MKIYFLTALISFLLSACVKLQSMALPVNQYIDWQVRQQQLEQLKTWKIRGAIAFRQGAQAENASFYLVQHTNHYQLEIYGPLGIGRTVLVGNTQYVSLKNSAGTVFTAVSPELLLQQHLGWALPVSNLRYWVRGLPASHLAQKIKFDRYHHIAQLQQQDWSIQYISYLSANGIDLPRKIIFQRQQVRVVLVISQWELA